MLKVTTIKTVNFLDALRVLQKEECEEFNILLPASGVCYKLPDGQENIHDRIWDKFASESQHGNQTFTNDSLFMVHLGDEYGEGLAPDMKKLAAICSHAMNKHGMVVFDVCW